MGKGGTFPSLEMWNMFFLVLHMQPAYSKQADKPKFSRLLSIFSLIIETFKISWLLSQQYYTAYHVIHLTSIGLERYWHWVIGYWAIFKGIGIGGIFFVVLTPNTIPIRQQSALSSVHMPVNDYLVPLVTCTLTDAIVCLDTMLISTVY